MIRIKKPKYDNYCTCCRKPFDDSMEVSFSHKDYNDSVNITLCGKCRRELMEALGKDIDVPTNSALDHIHNVVRDDAYKRGYEQGKADAVPAVSVNSNTFMIDVSEEDFDKINRVIVGCGPMCRTFYEEGGEAHWIKSYTPDDGEIYECDNCGVTWQFNDGGPEENEAYYCPKCGFKMVPKGEQHETD